jgi:hypothetical protein
MSHKIGSNGIRRLTTCAVVAFAAAMLLGVGASSAAPMGAHRTLKACRIATVADATVALGQASSAGHASTVDVWSACGFDAKKGFKVFTFEIASTAMIEKKHPGQTAAAEFKQAKSGGKSKSVSGVGQKAYWLVAYGVGELWVLKGDVVSSYTGVPKANAIAAAKRIVPRV